MAQLAAAYAEGSEEGGAVVPALAAAINKPVATVKGHMVKARKEGYLTEAEAGTSGGEVTDKAKKLLDY